MARIEQLPLIFCLTVLLGLFLGVLVSISVRVSDGWGQSSDGQPSFLHWVRKEEQLVTVPAGARIHVRLKQAITDDNRSGDSFAGSLDRPISHDGQLLAPEGSRVFGRLAGVSQGKAPGDATEVSMVLEQIVVDRSSFVLETATLTLPIPVEIVSIDGFFSAARTDAGRDQAVEGTNGTEHTAGVIYEPGTRFTFMLSEPLELPVADSS